MRQISLILVMSLCVFQNVLAMEFSDVVEGSQYQRAGLDITNNELVQDLAKEANNKVQVIEFFSYGCSWCYHLDPHIEQWRKNAPANVSFQRIPVEFHPSWGTLTKAYYTQVDLNAVDKIHADLFHALQTEKIPNGAEATLRQYFMSKGIKEKDFNQTYNSFDVTRKQKWANAMSRAYRITAVPAIIVQGPKGTFMTSVTMAGSDNGLVKVLNYLVKMQSEDKALSKKAPNAKKEYNKQ